ncbi:MAG: GDSL-type esterase/lipase family protein [Bacteroidales bacterium]|nr:GDSL-type esterase/lipase family protein [Bacteroidales bacterium]
MKKILLTATMIIGMACMMWGQEAKYTPLYYHRASLFEVLPIEKSDIVFLGNSIIHYCEWAELFNDSHIKNRGISGDIVQGVYDRLDPIIKGQPKKIFLMIGVNNLSRDYTVDSTYRGLVKIVDKLTKECPTTKLYIQSGLPVNSTFTNYPKHRTRGEEIKLYNSMIEKMCNEKGITFINLYPLFKCKDSDELDPKYTKDGLHLSGEAYLIWRDAIKKYVK